MYSMLCLGKESGMDKLNQIVDYYTKYRNCIGLYNSQAVGLRQDGTVVVAGVRNLEAVHKVSIWRNIASVSIGENIITGVKTDGTVLQVYWYYDEKKNTYDTNDGQFKTDNWKDIKTVCSPSSYYVFGLKKDGTVLVCDFATSDDYKEAVMQPISRWRNIVAIFCNCDTLVGLKADGSLVKITWERVTSSSGYGSVYNSTVKDLVNPQGEIIKDIVFAYPHGKEKAYIKSDGSILTDDDRLKQLENLADIVSITAKTWRDEYESGTINYFFALKSDGTVVTTGHENAIDVSSLQDIVAISAHRDHFIGLKSNGTVVSLEAEDADKLNISNWTNIGPVLENEVIERQRKDTEQSTLWINQGKCRVCGGSIGGLFVKKCKKCGAPR